jgi:hypothetical protein
MKVASVVLAILAAAASGWAEDDVRKKRSPWAIVSGEALKWKSFTEMNEHYENEFVKAEGFGISRMPSIPEIKQFEIADRKYRVGRVQLVGIVDRDAPAVYQTHTFFKKETIKKAKNRKATEAESLALAQLKDGKEWVTLAGKHSVLVGALRAKASCVKCHEGVTQNQLLGAFRYELYEVPKPELRPKQKTQPQTETLPEVLPTS